MFIIDQDSCKWLNPFLLYNQKEMINIVRYLVAYGIHEQHSQKHCSQKKLWSPPPYHLGETSPLHHLHLTVSTIWDRVPEPPQLPSGNLSTLLPPEVPNDLPMWCLPTPKFSISISDWRNQSYMPGCGKIAPVMKQGNETLFTILKYNIPF